MQVKELGHLVLYVRNLERPRGFYDDLLGWKAINVPGQDVGIPAATYSDSRSEKPTPSCGLARFGFEPPPYPPPQVGREI